MDFETIEEAIEAYKQLEESKNKEIAALTAKRDELLGKLNKAKPAIELLRQYPDISIASWESNQSRITELESSMEEAVKKATGAASSASDEKIKAFEVKLKQLQDKADEQERRAEDERIRREQSELDRDVIDIFGSPELELCSPHQMRTLLGNKIVRGDDGTPHYQENEYVDSVPIAQYIQTLKDNPQWQNQFKAPAGGSGTEPASGKNRPKTVNPYAKETFNLTQQGLLESDPSKAALVTQFKRDAGIPA